MNLKINDKDIQVDVDPNTPLLWVLRENCGLTGTKFGCGIGQCGACTVQLDGTATRSCLLPVQSAENKEITTIEGISKDPEALHVLQEVWIEKQVPQCGYCQSGQLMSAHALLAKNLQPTDEDIDSGMKGNICRCGTYPRIRESIKEAARILALKAKVEEDGKME